MSRQYDNQGGDQINVEHNSGTLIVHPQVAPFRSRGKSHSRQMLLTRVQHEVESRLEQSLHQSVFLNLGKEAQHGQVKRFWNGEIKIGKRVAKTIPEDTTISEVFDYPEIMGNLLILGRPGSGKTTTLLDLARVLLQRSSEDLRYPIPVLFNLSTWKDENQLIKDWIVTELKSKYKFSLKLGKQWVGTRILLPLLDGLDEVSQERQENCVKRINEFLNSELSPLYTVVCSRIDEYENYKTPLELNGAVYLREMKDQQIKEYLREIHRGELWPIFAQHSKLLELVRSPLLLNMAVIAYQQEFPQKWQQLQTADDQLSYLLDAYIEQMLHRDIINSAYAQDKVPTANQVCLWLIWLAKHMEQAFQTEFLIEEMQPTLLPHVQKQKYELGIKLSFWLSFLLSLLLILGLSLVIMNQTLNRYSYLLSFIVGFGLIGLSLVGLIFGQNGKQVFLLAFGSNGGLISALTSKIEAIEVLKWSRRKFITNGLIGGVVVGLISGFGFSLISGLSLGLIVGLMGGIDFEPADIKMLSNQGIKRSAIICVSFGLLIGLMSGLLIGLIGGLLIGLMSGLLIGLITWLSWGGMICIQHFMLRLLLYQSKSIPWNYAKFLDHCTERLLIQRVGGRYRFVHKLLQEHFARMSVDTIGDL